MHLPIFDTSVLIPLLDAGHKDHAAAREAAARHKVWNVPAGVVVEVTQVIRRLANARGSDGNAAARRALDALESTAAYRYLDRHDMGLASRIYQTNPGLSYADAWGISLALERDEPLVTHDERQMRVLDRLR